MQIIIGLLIIFGCVLGGYLMHGGNIGTLIQPSEFLIIFGAAIGATVVGNPPQVLKEIVGQVKGLFSAPKGTVDRQYFLELLAVMQALLETIRASGFKALDSHIENPDESPLFARYPLIKKDFRLIAFISDNLRLMAMGQMTAHELETLLEEEIEAIESDLLLPSKSLGRTGEALPGFGILAAVGGIIITMQAIGGSITEIGYLVAVALVGTFIGIFACYCITDPLSNAMSQRVKRNMTAYHCVKATLVTYLSKKPTLIAVDAGRKHIQLDVKPTFNEMETWLTEQEG